jgi:excinuclease UvrABC nuclease subunit
MPGFYHENGREFYRDADGRVTFLPFGMSAWRCHWAEEDDPRNIPNRPGVYAISLGGDLMYIGSTKRLRHRIREHCASGYFRDALDFGGVVEFRYKESRRRGDWLSLEYRLVSRIKPPLNKAFVNHVYMPYADPWESSR